MIVERMPDFLSKHNHNKSDSVNFDRNGRFVYVKREVQLENPRFLVYDIMFDSYIELTAGESISKVQAVNKYAFADYISGTIPISTSQLIYMHTLDSLFILLVLVGFDFKTKKYELLDQVKVEKCYLLKLMRDGDTFGVFYIKNEKGEETHEVDNEDSKFALLTFKIQENRIVLNPTIKRFNHRPCNSTRNPLDVYLRRDKLWFVRRKDGPFLAPFIRPGEPIPPPDPSKNDFLISYFDLNEEEPTEKHADDIYLCAAGLPDISTFNWVQDYMIIQLTKPKFDVFDLNKCSWSPEGIKYSGYFYANTEDDDCTFANRDEEWVDFKVQDYGEPHWNNFSTIHIDDQFVISAVNRRTAALHLIPVRRPQKLIDISWLTALNAGHLKSNKNLPNVPYSRLF